MASLTQWTWVCSNSGRWWRTGKSGVLRSKGSQRVRHNWVTEQQLLRKRSFSLPRGWATKTVTCGAGENSYGWEGQQEEKLHHPGQDRSPPRSWFSEPSCLHSHVHVRQEIGSRLRRWDWCPVDRYSTTAGLREDLSSAQISHQRNHIPHSQSRGDLPDHKHTERLLGNPKRGGITSQWYQPTHRPLH